jgi:hypothetical protein
MNRAQKGGMIRSIRDQVTIAHNKATGIRRLVNTDRFVHAFLSATEDQIEKIEGYIKANDLERAKHWVYRVLKDTYEAMTYQELRLIGATRGIKYYSKMSKEALIRAIEEDDKSKENKGTTNES